MFGSSSRWQTLAIRLSRVGLAVTAAGCASPSSPTAQDEEPEERLDAAAVRDTRRPSSGSDAASGGVDAPVSTATDGPIGGSGGTGSTDAAGVDGSSIPTVVDAAPLNGKAVKRRVDTYTASRPYQLSTVTAPLRIGAAADGKEGFNGLIDRIRLYNIAISDEDALAHGKGSLEPCTSSPECVADWTFDTLDNGGFTSTGPKSLPAKIQGELPLVDGREAGSKAINVLMNGITAKGWLEVAQDPSLAFKQEFTLEAWILFTNDCGGKCQSYQLVDDRPSWNWEIHGGAMVVRGGSGISVNGSLEFPKNRTWHHYAMTFTKNEARFFLDGNEMKTKTLRAP